MIVQVFFSAGYIGCFVTSTDIKNILIQTSQLVKHNEWITSWTQDYTSMTLRTNDFHDATALFDLLKESNETKRN